MSTVVSLTERLKPARTQQLVDALLAEDTETAKRLLQGPIDFTLSFDFEVPRFQTLRALDIAIFQGQTELALLMIEAGAPLEQNPDVEGWTASILSEPLALAARECNREVIEAIGRKLPAEDFQERLNERLHGAAVGANLEALLLLVDLGGQCTVHGPTSGYTPLHQAAAWGHTAIIDQLLSLGAQWEAQDVKGYTPADFLKRNHPQLAQRYGVAGDSSVMPMLRAVGKR